MSCEKFKTINFQAAALARIEQAREILRDPEYADTRLTLRQLYYQFVSRNLITNEEKSYKNLAGLISDARLAGLINWDAIEDRGRVPTIPLEFTSLRHRVDSAIANYRLPRWEGQETYAELWVEKQALAGVLEPLAHEFHVTLVVNKGYSSSSAMYDASKRFLDACGNCEREPRLFYLGDHDPSGEDMVRDIRERLELFGVEGIKVEKVALTTAQVRQYNPPPNPAKMTDSRAAAYVAIHGRRSWEVDALPPTVLTRLVRAAFRRIIDRPMMDAVIEEEERGKAALLEATRTVT